VAAFYRRSIKGKVRLPHRVLSVTGRERTFD
jgi:hypothetical protein